MLSICNTCLIKYTFYLITKSLGLGCYKNDYILKIILIFKETIYLERDYDLKNNRNSEGTETIEWTILL